MFYKMPGVKKKKKQRRKQRKKHEQILFVLCTIFTVYTRTLGLKSRGAASIGVFPRVKHSEKIALREVKGRGAASIGVRLQLENLRYLLSGSPTLYVCIVTLCTRGLNIDIVPVDRLVFLIKYV